MSGWACLPCGGGGGGGRGPSADSWEPPIFAPVLAAHKQGAAGLAAELEDFIGESRGVVGAANTELAVVPPASPTACYSCVPTRLRQPTGQRAQLCQQLAGRSGAYRLLCPRALAAAAGLTDCCTMCASFRADGTPANHDRGCLPAPARSITGQKAVAAGLGEGNLGPCRLPLTSLPAALAPKLVAAVKARLGPAPAPEEDAAGPKPGVAKL